MSDYDYQGPYYGGPQVPLLEPSFLRLRAPPWLLLALSGSINLATTFAKHQTGRHSGCDHRRSRRRAGRGDRQPAEDHDDRECGCLAERPVRVCSTARCNRACGLGSKSRPDIRSAMWSSFTPCRSRMDRRRRNGSQHLHQLSRPHPRGSGRSGPRRIGPAGTIGFG